jgi:hypothetical protein
MSLSRTLLVFTIAATAALPAAAQDSLSWRWRPATSFGSTSLGLTLGRAPAPVYCGSVLFPCDPSLAQGLNFNVTSRTQLGAGFNVYGRLGTSQGRGLPGSPVADADSYGVGVSWDFTPRATATLGWDLYDFRTAAGRDPVRFTSLGLQWRY